MQSEAESKGENKSRPSTRANAKKEGKPLSKFPSSPAIDLDAVYPPSSTTITNRDDSDNNNSNQRKPQAQRFAQPFSIGAGSQMRRYGGAPVKVLKVKNLRTTTTTSSGSSTPSKGDDEKNDAAERYFKETWKKLDQALVAVLEASPTSIFLEELYRAVENLCRAGKSKPLWDLVYSRLQTHFQSSFGPNLWGKIAKASPEDVLTLTNTAWQMWGDQARMIRNIFYYLDRSYLLRFSRDGDIGAVCTKLFGEMMAKQQEGRIFQVYSNGILIMFNQQRVSNTVSPILIASSLSMLDSLGLFKGKFLDQLLKWTYEFYREGSIDESKRSLQEYIEQCFKHLTNEGIILESIGMDSEASDKVMEQVRNALIRHYAHILTSVENEEIGAFFDRVLDQLPNYSRDQSMGNVKIMSENIISSGKEGPVRLFIIWYDMMIGVYPERREIATVWGDYIMQRGKMIICDDEEGEEQEQNKKTMIKRLLNFKFKIECIERKVFDVEKEGSQDIIRQISRKRFEEFVNIRPDGAIAEMIAKYGDELLAKSGNNKLMSETNLEEQLSNLLELFRFVYSKDIFEGFYKRYLSKRLLLNRSVSIDAEESMIRKLTVECGPGYTQQLEQMFNDMQLSKELMVKAKAVRKSKIDFSANILSEASWPSIPAGETGVILPPEMGLTLQEFEGFYKSQHSGRRLSWRHILGQCVVRGEFQMGRRELVMGTFQTLVILLFNSNERLTFQEIQEETKLEHKELVRTLLSLTCGKVRILTKQPPFLTKSREIDVKDMFRVNEKFNDGGAFRIKINQIQSKNEDQAESLKVKSQVERDRQYEIQAAITRIMKSRKKLTHQDLIAQTIDQIKNRGQPNIADIKRNIGKLLERDYITRNASTNTYEYIA